jgi:hypothetical protein
MSTKILNSETAKKIHDAVDDAATALYENTGFKFGVMPNIQLNDSDVFSARAHLGENSISIEINHGCIEQIETLWDAVFNERILLDVDGKRLSNPDGEPLDKDYLIHISLIWLALHELMHVRLGHLDLLDVTSLAEVEPASERFKSKLEQSLAEHFSEGELKLVRPCLELQADNDATEILFGSYDENKWDQFRIEAASIFVVMALMERAETDIDVSEEERTYPKVGTRFFTLFAQLFQYWLYGDAKLEAGNGESFVRTERQPQGEDFERYAKTVLALTISDAIQIAASAGVTSFLDDIGAGHGFFEDIYKIQYAESLAEAELCTEAAKQWRELLPINEKFMAMSGLRD